MCDQREGNLKRPVDVVLAEVIRIRKNKMKTFETSCSRLPIPSLEETAERYLKSVSHLFTSKQEFTHYTHLVHDFVHGQGPELQKRLLDYDKTQPYSWLENWWLSLAYLSWRESVLINSNWYIIVQPHPNYGESLHQIKRASGFIKSFLDFKLSLDRLLILVKR